MAVHYYPLINKVLTRLKIRDKLAFMNRGEPEKEFARPFITIAREPGSGGAPIATAVADALGFRCIDEEIIDEIARSTKKRKEIVQAIDEKSRTVIEDLVHSLLNSEYLDDLKYVTELVKVILTYAHEGEVVILGRGANFITPFGQGLHVNIRAPYKVRIQRAMKYEGHTEAQAKRVLGKVEKERFDFVQQYLKQDVTKGNSYDLTINTAYFNVQQARDLILQAFYLKFPRTARYKALFTK